ncbi:hypothetical protein GCM10017624_46340 [Azotobacter vinelandii]|nr:hypothetical protein BURPS305_0006 [Burkholderia pseudomallei 305]GLK62468.1 hypothetical protein GCM10017624_46340 [Azotobacter vinelandii]SFY29742.1 hypothetical protein SAMN04244547_04956 [Azotobacter vinelandii]
MGCLFGKVKYYRRIVTRYEKKACSFTEVHASSSYYCGYVITLIESVIRN